jgi:hypothetical protein
MTASFHVLLQHYSLFTLLFDAMYSDVPAVPLNNPEMNNVLDASDRNEPMYIYRISYTFYTMIGVATAIIVGLVVSFLTKPNNLEDVDSDLITPVIHRFLPSRVKHIELEANKQVSHMALPSFICLFNTTLSFPFYTG